MVTGVVEVIDRSLSASEVSEGTSCMLADSECKVVAMLGFICNFGAVRAKIRKERELRGQCRDQSIVERAQGDPHFISSSPLDVGEGGVESLGNANRSSPCGKGCLLNQVHK